MSVVTSYTEDLNSVRRGLSSLLTSLEWVRDVILRPLGEELLARE
jgi:energy-converting hydrogenase A subunit M